MMDDEDRNKWLEEREYIRRKTVLLDRDEKMREAGNRLFIMAIAFMLCMLALGWYVFTGCMNAVFGPGN